MIHFKHNFQEVERFYAEPVDDVSVEADNSDQMDRFVFGQTTILYKCVEIEGTKFVAVNGEETLLNLPKEGCGLTRQEKILGKSTK